MTAPGGSRVRAGLDRLIDHAVTDLAGRLSIDPGEIRVVETRSVVWPDASLGCPRPGMVYPQVQTDGVLIRLEANGVIYPYHGGGGRAPFLCGNVLRPVPDALTRPPKD